MHNRTCESLLFPDVSQHCITVTYLVNGNKVEVRKGVLSEERQHGTTRQTARPTTMGKYVTLLCWLNIGKTDTHVDLNRRKNLIGIGSQVRLHKTTGPGGCHDFIRIHPFKEVRVDSLLEKANRLGLVIINSL